MSSARSISMGWCSDHLQACIFSTDEELRTRHCPEVSGGECTLVHIMLAVHSMPEAIRRRLIAALYPAYGIEEADAAPEKPARRPTPRTDH